MTVELLKHRIGSMGFARGVLYAVADELETGVSVALAANRVLASLRSTQPGGKVSYEVLAWFAVVRKLDIPGERENWPFQLRQDADATGDTHDGGGAGVESQ